jgi:3-phosphoshikimate 1-carboxyvinyltransferase
MGESQPSYPDVLEIETVSTPLHGKVQVPGSKSITNRAMILGALSTPRAGGVLTGALCSEDTKIMAEGLRRLGFDIETAWQESRIHVCRSPDTDLIPSKKADIQVGNSGTTMRFLTALCSLGDGLYRLDGVERMRERPIEDLLTALRQLGVRAYSEQGTGCAPVIVEASGLKGGSVTIRGNVSSQFVSALLMAAPFARNQVDVRLEGPLVSRPYLNMTVRMMEEFGANVQTDGTSYFSVPAQSCYLGRSYSIEPDASAASYFLAAAAITGGQVEIPGLGHTSLQGDIRFVDVLKEMGCRAEEVDGGTRLAGKALSGIDADMNDISDCTMTLAAVALFAEGRTTIRNVAHIRYKETDRLAALANELRRLGALVEELPDGLTITPTRLHGAMVDTYDDHRMAMSLALVGLRVPGVGIQNPGCVAKTYPSFFDDLETLRRFGRVN